MNPLGYKLVDMDQHYYESRYCVSRHIEPAFRDRAMRTEQGTDGTETFFFDDRAYRFLPDPFAQAHFKPGSLGKLYDADASDQPGFFIGDAMEPMRNEYRDRDARIVTMDEQEVEAAAFFPTFAVTFEALIEHDPDLTFGVLRAFNRWLDEDWGFNHKNRIYAVPLLSLVDLSQAVAELDWVLANGARAVHLNAGPQGDKSPADPCFDPFWARLNEASIPVTFHVGHSSYLQKLSRSWSEDPDQAAFTFSCFQWAFLMKDRPLMDTLGALIFHNLFGRFPNLKVACIEHGSGWVEYLLHALDHNFKLGQTGQWLGGKLSERPSEVFKNHVHVAPFFEEDGTALANMIGADRVLGGSDWPHGEGTEQPLGIAKTFDGLTASERKLVLRGNGNLLLGRS